MKDDKLQKSNMNKIVKQIHKRKKMQQKLITKKLTRRVIPEKSRDDYNVFLTEDWDFLATTFQPFR